MKVLPGESGVGQKPFYENIKIFHPILNRKNTPWVLLSFDKSYFPPSIYFLYFFPSHLLSNDQTYIIGLNIHFVMFNQKKFWELQSMKKKTFQKKNKKTNEPTKIITRGSKTKPKKFYF